MFTKALGAESFLKLIKRLGVINIFASIVTFPHTSCEEQKAKVMLLRGGVKSPHKISQQSSLTQTTKVVSDAANTEVRSTSQASCVASNAAVADDRCVDQTTKAAAADDECTSQSTGIASRGLLSTAVLEMLEAIPDHDFFIQ